MNRTTALILVSTLFMAMTVVHCQTQGLVLPNSLSSKQKGNCRYGKCQGDPWKFLSVPFSSKDSITVAWIKNPVTVGTSVSNYTVYYRHISETSIGKKFANNALESFNAVDLIEGGTLVGTKTNADSALQYLEIEIKGLKEKSRYEINLVAVNNGTKVPFEGVVAFTQGFTTDLTDDMAFSFVWLPFLITTLVCGFGCVAVAIMNETEEKETLLGLGFLAFVVFCLMFFLGLFVYFIPLQQSLQTSQNNVIPCYVENVITDPDDSITYAFFRVQERLSFVNRTLEEVVTAETVENTKKLKGQNTMCFENEVTLYIAPYLAYEAGGLITVFILSGIFLACIFATAANYFKWWFHRYR